MKDENPTHKGLRYGKLEFAILGALTLILANSAYQLICGAPDSVSQNRAPAAVANTRLGEQAESYEIKCAAAGDAFVTTASRVRITGVFCGAPQTDDAEDSAPEPRAIAATNVSSSYSATVFKDSAAKRFSTDFIPIDVGSNKIQVDFQYPAHQTARIEVNIERKEKN